MRRTFVVPVPLVVMLVLGCEGCDSEEPMPSAEAVAPAPVPAQSAPAPLLRDPTAPGVTEKTPSGLSYSTLKGGEGAQVKEGQTVAVHALGTLDDGKVFLDTRKAGQTWSFKVGDPDVVQGVNEGVAGMRPGEKRKLTIPPQIGYGALGTFVKGEKENAPSIPPNATLTYEIELVEVK